MAAPVSASLFLSFTLIASVYFAIFNNSVVIEVSDQRRYNRKRQTYPVVNLIASNRQ
nr:hypothetical protein [Lactiplantibacillus plantarum]